MLGKKGIKLSLWVFVDIIFITILILSVFPFINDVKESTYFEKKYFSKDMALLMNTIQSLPGDVIYSYSEETLDFSSYNFKFQKNKVSVAEGKFERGSYLSYPFYDNRFLMNDYSGKINNPSSIYFSKSLDSMHINAEGAGLSMKDCPGVEGTKVSEAGRVFIVHDNSKQEATKLSALIDNARVYEKNNLQSGLQAPVLLYVQAKNSGSGSVKLYYMNSKKTTFSLGCYMRNSIADDGVFSNVRFLPGHSSSINADGFLAIKLTIEYKDESALEYLAASINRGINEYDRNVQ